MDLDDTGITPLLHEDGRPYGYRVKTTERYHIDVYRMVVNWRLATVPVDGPLRLSREWCYTGPNALRNAVLAALAWDGADDTAPDGWYRDVNTGERRPAYLFQAS